MKSAYLALYNALSLTAWAAILYTTVVDASNGFVARDHSEYPHRLLVNVQVVNALFETGHAVSGLVPLPLLSILLQFFARLVIVAISYFVPNSEGNFSPAYIALSLAWSVTEVIRYSFYFAKQFGEVPYFLQWLRYSAFVVLYPLGLVSEPVVVYLTLAYVQGVYYWFLVLSLPLYIPGFIKLYGYMWRQRRKYLN